MDMDSNNFKRPTATANTSRGGTRNANNGRNSSARYYNNNSNQQNYISINTNSVAQNSNRYQKAVQPSSSSSSSLVFVPSKRQKMRSECNGRENATGSPNGLIPSSHSICLATAGIKNTLRNVAPQRNGENRHNHHQQQHYRRRYESETMNQNNSTLGPGPPPPSTFFHTVQTMTTNSPSSAAAERTLAFAEQVVQTQTKVRSQEHSDIPGFSYDPIMKKYFKILDNVPGQPIGSTHRHLRNLAICNANLSALTQMKKTSKENSVNLAKSLPNLLKYLQIGSGGKGLDMVQNGLRMVEEGRVRAVKPLPSHNVEVIDFWSQRFNGCQWLDVSEDGKTLIGCWSTERRDIFAGQCCRVLSFNVGVDRERAKKDAQFLVDDPKRLYDSNGRYSCNTYGLRFDPLDNGICLESSNRLLVDMVLAPADRDVTCLLFATAHSSYQNSDGRSKIVTKCTVHLRPIEFNLTEEGRESMSSPIYNAEWTSTEPIWSLCFNSNHMKICVGMEKCAKILNVLSSERSHNFYVSSGGKNVISCEFSKDGNSLYLGRKNANVNILDIRMAASRAPVMELPDSTSTGYMHLMRDWPNTLLTESFEGKIRLWDLRTRQCIQEMQPGHRNSSHKLPCFVDPKDRFVFAVGEDAVVRGWSLHTGELLCSVNSPRLHIQQKIGMDALTSESIDFPRVVYSSCWAGKAGNSALIFAVNGDLIVHELLI